MLLLRECQDEIAATGAHPHYLAAYRREEFSYWQHIPRWIYEDVAQRRPATCLDIGCAYGTLLLYVGKLANCRLYAMDFIDDYISPELIAKHDVQFAVNNIELDSPPWDGPFDLIIFTEVLEHLNFNAVPTLRKIGGLLSPGGKLYLSTPDAAAWGKTTKYYGSYDELPLPDEQLRSRIVDDHVWQFDVEELDALLDKAGFDVVRREFAPGSPYRHFNLTLQKS